MEAHLGETECTLDLVIREIATEVISVAFSPSVHVVQTVVRMLLPGEQRPSGRRQLEVSEIIKRVKERWQILDTILDQERMSLPIELPHDALRARTHQPNF